MAADGRERWYPASRTRLKDENGRVFALSVLQDGTAEHVARERADRSAREIDDWFDLSPIGMVLFDEAGLLVRTNPAFDALAGVVPAVLSEASPDLRHLLAWTDAGPSPELQPGAKPVVAQGWLPQPQGGQRRLRSIVRGYTTASGQRRHMAILEDRSIEEERDLAQMQIGALMDTAGVGLATFQETSGWVRRSRNRRAAPTGRFGPSTERESHCRQRPAIHQPRHWCCPRSRWPEYERLAARPAQRGSAPRCATRSVIPTSACAGCSPASSPPRWPRANAPPRWSRSTSPSSTSRSNAASSCCAS